MSAESPKSAQVVRMSLMYRVQHLLLMVTLLVLALTGFTLMYHENWLGRTLIRLEGGVLFRGFIHRAAAVLLMAQLVYHAFYMLFSREGKREMRDVLLRRQDFDDFLQAIRYNLGLAGEYPRFGKYGYKEKFQYWGATSGVFLISVTGVILWVETFSMKFLPKFVLDLTLIIHGYQGLLLFVILLFWHVYNEHLHPSVFPMNMAWLTGKVEVEWLRQEHPLEYEKLKQEGII
ncbi:MAG: cytochrome b/b6 domain-containing protein [Deltaproteobacteria bacterium]|nr:cytochrome b/b6 domain-containing protein [Deltaproteobacteria bacterium]